MITSIIGGGAIGAYLGSRLKGDVRIFEEHLQIGEPVQCSGIFTHNIAKLIKMKDDFVLNKIGSVKLVSASGNSCEFDLKKKDFVVDRGEFDRSLMDMALDKGVKLFKGHKFKGVKDGKLKFGNGSEFDNDFLVGCDGPNSVVRKEFFNWKPKRMWVGKQARVKGNFDVDVFEAHFCVPGFFGWVIPESDGVARVAVASERNVEEYFNSFMDKLGVREVLDVQAGVIPRYEHRVRLWDGSKSFLVGDSAGMVKALSGGGVYPGLCGAKILARVLNSDRDFGSYEKKFRKQVGRNLFYNLKIRDFLDKFDEKDYDKLISLFDEHDFSGFDRDKINFKEMLQFVKPDLMWFGLKKLFG